jgi:hypothetical protein
MKAIKGLLPLASWFLRISILLFAYVYFFDTVKTFSFSGLYYFIALLFCISTILLFIGGLLKKPTMTIFSAILLLLVSAYQLFSLFDFNISQDFSMFFFIASANLFFISMGNKT